MEEYKGIKFRNIIIEKAFVDNELLPRLIDWCNRLSELGLAPLHGKGSAGNLSFRTARGFVITNSGTDLGSIKRKDFSEVLTIDKGIVYSRGFREPSSESMLHFALYGKREDINAIFHGHYDKLDIPCTMNERPYGTRELADEAVRLCSHDLFMLKNHGFISLGSGLDDAGNRIISKIT